MQSRCPACKQLSELVEDHASHSYHCSACGVKLSRRGSKSDSSASSRVSAAGPTSGGAKSATGPAAEDIGIKSAPSPEAARCIGRFHIQEELGAGAFGTVYRAHDPQLDREVALKVPHAHRLGDTRTVERFLREAKAAARLRHPHIVTMYEAGQDGQHSYIASEFIPGKTLQDVIDGRKLFPRETAEIVRELAEALAYAHEMGIVHRDVKPANIMLDGKGKAHLMDFGLAHRQDIEQKLTQEGAVLGTPAYMSPEQAAGKRGDPLPASDQYSLGVVLYELLCGQTPFSGPPAVQLANHVAVQPQSPRAVNPQVPRDLETVCLKALSKRPQERYPSCQALADDLRRWLEGEPITARRLSVAERVWRWCSHNRALAAASAAALVLLISVAVVSAVSAARLAAAVSRESKAKEEAEQNKNEAVENARLAQERQNEALNNARLAQQQSDALAQANGQLQQKTKLAEENAAKASAAADEAQREKLRATREAEQAYRLLHVAYLNQIQRFWEAGDRAGMRTLLKGQGIAKGQPDLRSFDWYYYWNLAHPERLTLPGVTQKFANDDLIDAPYGPPAIVFDPKGETFVVHNGREAKLWETATGKELASLRRPPYGLIGAVAYRIRTKTWVAAVLSPQSKGFTVWDLKAGKELVALPMKEKQDKLKEETFLRLVQWFGLVRFSPDGRTLLAATGEAWDVDSGTTRDVSVALLNRCPIAVFRNGLVAAIESGKGFELLALVDIEKGAFDSGGGQKRVVPSLGLPWANASQQVALSDFAFSPDGELAAGAFGDGSIVVWELRSGKSRSWKEHKAQVLSVSFSSDSKTLASAGRDGTIRIWDVATGRMQAVLPLDLDLSPGAEQRAAVAFAPAGRTLISSAHGQVKVWELGRLQESSLLLGHHDGPIDALEFTPDGKVLLVAAGLRGHHGADGGQLKLWDADTGQARVNLLGADGPPAKEQSAPVKKGGRPAKEQPVPLAKKGGCFRFALSPNGKLLAAEGHTQEANRFERFLRIWEVATGKEQITISLRELEQGRRASLLLRRLAFSADGATLISAGAFATGEGDIRFWDVATGMQRGTLALTSGMKTSSNDLHLSPDGKTLVSQPYTSRKGEAGAWYQAPEGLKFWDTATRQERQILPKGTKLTASPLAFSPDSRILLVGDWKGNVQLWDIVSGQHKGTLQVGEGFRSAAFSPDGRTLAVLQDLGAEPHATTLAKLWDVKEGKERATLTGHTDWISALAFCPDGRTLATGSLDRTVRLWDVATGLERTTFAGHPSGVSAIAFAADGRMLAVGCQDGTVKLWRASRVEKPASTPEGQQP